ncbi:transposase, partial [mine drainage metagenome]
TCYGASSFLRLGETAGYGRRSGRYVAHGQIKHVYVRSLHRRSREVLSGTFDHPLLLANPRSEVAQIDFNTADLSSLIERLETITDPRDPRGVRHDFASTLVLIACATLAGNKSLVALSEWCDSSSQEVLCRLGARISPATGLRIPPSYATIRRAAMEVN